MSEHVKKIARLFGMALVVFALVLPEIGGKAAFAQSRDGRPNILELLFGGGLRKQRDINRRREVRPNARRVIVNRGGGQVRRAGQPAPKAVIKKAEDAAVVLVVGDFLADGLHWGLQQAYSENANVVFVDKSSGLSGMVRDDVVDWPARTPELIEELKPVAVVVAVGMNDRQLMRTPQGRLEKLGEPWLKEYRSRIQRLTKTVRDRGLPLIWLGLPAVSSSRMNSDYLVFNEIYRGLVEVEGGKFVDIWDGFTNAEGAFITAGPDVNGQIVRLRNSDGINMTRAGKRKLAFYVERALRKETGLGSDAVLAVLPGPSGAEVFKDPEYEPAKTGRTILISLDDPRLDGAETLSGGDEKEAEDGPSTARRFVDDGIALAPKSGRIDADWGLPEPKKAETENEEEAAGSDGASGGTGG